MRTACLASSAGQSLHVDVQSPRLRVAPRAVLACTRSRSSLLRGAALGLPSGEAVADALSVEPLPADQLAPAMPGRTPLWFYVLREAQVEHGGEHLGPVGGRILDETLLGLLRADQQSYLRVDPAWQPELPARSGDPSAFDMADRLAYAVPDQTGRFQPAGPAAAASAPSATAASSRTITSVAHPHLTGAGWQPGPILTTQLDPGRVGPTGRGRPHVRGHGVVAE